MKPYMLRLVVGLLILLAVGSALVAIKGAVIWYKASNAPPYRGRVFWEQVLYSSDIARETGMGISLTVGGSVVATLSAAGALVARRRFAGRLIPTEWLTHARRPGLILALGIMGIVVFPVFGIAAWIMANRELRRIKEGSVAPESRGLITAGRICGMIGTIVGPLYWAVVLALGALGVLD